MLTVKNYLKFYRKQFSISSNTSKSIHNIHTIIYIYTHIYLYMHMYTQIYTHIHTYTYICIDQYSLILRTYFLTVYSLILLTQLNVHCYFTQCPFSPHRMPLKCSLSIPLVGYSWPFHGHLSVMMYHSIYVLTTVTL